MKLAAAGPMARPTAPPENEPLRIDWASVAAAKFACEHWHYSRCTPGLETFAVRVGAWEGPRFIGSVIFGMGANNHIGWPYGLAQHECCELTRIALTRHRAPVSRIVRIAILFLRRKCPGLQLIVSYADAAQGHHGGIYQALGWIYVGEIASKTVILHGEAFHPRTTCERYGKGGNSVPWLRKHVDPNASRQDNAPKHKYLLPLNAQMREKLQPLAQPYPKRAQVQLESSLCC